MRRTDAVVPLLLVAALATALPVACRPNPPPSAPPLPQVDSAPSAPDSSDPSDTRGAFDTPTTPALFPAAKHGAGELTYVSGVPVLTVRGHPAEMGEQFGILAVKNAPDLTGLHRQFLKDAGIETQYPVVSALAGLLQANFPPHIREEIEAAAEASGRDLGLLVFANTIADLTSGMGCSTLVVGPDRSASGGTLFGRNFDWYPTRGITEHTLLVVYKGVGRRAFAAVTISPISGVISGMNDAGLCVTMNEIRIRSSRDNAAFNWRGIPIMLAFRRVLEECATVAEAERFLRGLSCTTTVCMTVCDPNDGAVFEITPRSLEVRGFENGAVCCTNHFRSEPLCTDSRCPRYDRLAPLLDRSAGRLDVPGVFAELDKVHQRTHTIQSMVFEPGRRVLHLAYGDGPATKLRPRRLDLGRLFDD